MKDLIQYAIAGLKHWWNTHVCDHDYVIEHYDNLGAFERCTKCGRINQLGR